MAQGYARATGKVGVAIATSGPGATNLVTPIADAYLDSTPIVCITGQVPTHLIGTDAFQEADIQGITMPVVKHSWLVDRAEDIPRIVKEAFHIARSGRPGPGADRHPQGPAAGGDHVRALQAGRHPGLQALAARPSQAGDHRRRGDPGRRAAGVLRGRRHRLRQRRPRRSDPHRRGGADAGGDNADGQGRVPRLASALHRPARHARLQGRELGAEPGRPADRLRVALRRPRDGQAGHVRARREGDPHGRRSGRDRQEPDGADPDRGLAGAGRAEAGRGAAVAR